MSLMLLRNKIDVLKKDKMRLSYLCALSLFLSYAEMFIPRIIPFFKLGLSNICVLSSLSFSPLSFLVLLFIKAFCSSMVSGTLYTPFFLISLIQSFASGFAMYVVYKINHKFRKSLFSVYGLSVLGSAISAFVQVFCCVFLLGDGVKTLLGPMLLFSVVSGLIVAWVFELLEICETAPLLLEEGKSANDKKSKLYFSEVIIPLIFVVSIIVIFNIKNVKLLFVIMIACLIIQKITGRKIFLYQYFFMAIFIIISSLLVPQGKVIFDVWKIKITQGALMEGCQKAFILTSVMALSQSLASFNFIKNNSFFGLVFLYYKKLKERFDSSSGNVFRKIKSVLSAKKL